MLATASPIIRPRAFLFDMDGTLTEPMLDFPRIKADLGIGDRPILEALAEMKSGARQAAEAILHRHEEAAAACSTLNIGCHDLLALLKRLDIRAAVITRNSPRSIRTVFNRHGLAFEVVISREDGRPKPLPDGLHAACVRLGIAPEEAWMVGDGQYDIEAGNAAGIRTVWLSHGKARPFAAVPWRVVSDLQELAALLRQAGPDVSPRRVSIKQEAAP